MHEMAFSFIKNGNALITIQDGDLVTAVHLDVVICDMSNSTFQNNLERHQHTIANIYKSN